MRESLNEKIVSFLMNNNDFVTALEMSKQFHVNERTIRRRIQLINKSITKEVGKIESKPGRGYKLIVFDKELFGRLYDFAIAETGIDNPLNRRTMIFQYIVYNEGVDQDDLMNEFYISDTTLKTDIREINKYNADTKVEIIIKNNRYKVEGNEYYIRNAILKLNYDSSMVRALRRRTRETKQGVVSVVHRVLDYHRILLDKNNLDAIVNYVTVSVGSILHGHLIDLKLFIDEDKTDCNHFKIARDICDVVGELMHVTFPETEVAFLAYFLNAVLPLQAESNLNKRDAYFLKAQSQVQQTLNILFDIGLKVFDERTRFGLLEYFYGLNLRMLFDIQKREIDYLDIEVLYSRSYFFSKIIMSDIFGDRYISRDEISSLAQILQRFIFMNMEDKNKILVVLPTDENRKVIVKDQLRSIGDVEKHMIEYEAYIQSKEDYEKDEEYHLIVVPFYSLGKDVSGKYYFTKDFLTRNDFIKISRIISYLNHDLLKLNLQKMEDITRDIGFDKLVKTLSSETHYHASFLGSFICIKDLGETSIQYGLYDVGFEKNAIFVLNEKLNIDELLDLLRVVLDVVAKGKSTGTYFNQKRIIDYYTN